MEIIKGTPEEILEYHEQLNARKFPSALRQSTGREINQQRFREDRKEKAKHWSHNKMRWVNISDMDSSYILNVMRKMLRENKNENLLVNEEFQSLLINLVDKIVTGE